MKHMNALISFSLVDILLSLPLIPKGKKKTTKGRVQSRPHHYKNCAEVFLFGFEIMGNKKAMVPVRVKK